MDKIKRPVSTTTQATNTHNYNNKKGELGQTNLYHAPKVQQYLLIGDTRFNPQKIADLNRNGVKIDDRDLVLIDKIRQMRLSRKLRHVTVNGKDYVNVLYKKLITDLPYMGGEHVFQRHINKLIEYGMLERYMINNREPYYREGRRLDDILYCKGENYVRQEQEQGAQNCNPQGAQNCNPIDKLLSDIGYSINNKSENTNIFTVLLTNKRDDYQDYTLTFLEYYARNKTDGKELQGILETVSKATYGDTEHAERILVRVCDDIECGIITDIKPDKIAEYLVSVYYPVN